MYFFISGASIDPIVGLTSNCACKEDAYQRQSAAVRGNQSPIVGIHRRKRRFKTRIRLVDVLTNKGLTDRLSDKCRAAHRRGAHSLDPTLEGLDAVHGGTDTSIDGAADGPARLFGAGAHDDFELSEAELAVLVCVRPGEHVVDRLVVDAVLVHALDVRAHLVHGDRISRSHLVRVEGAHFRRHVRKGERRLQSRVGLVKILAEDGLYHRLHEIACGRHAAAGRARGVCTRAHHGANIPLGVIGGLLVGSPLALGRLVHAARDDAHEVEGDRSRLLCDERPKIGRSDHRLSIDRHDEIALAQLPTAHRRCALTDGREDDRLSIKRHAQPEAFVGLSFECHTERLDGELFHSLGRIRRRDCNLDARLVVWDSGSRAAGREAVDGEEPIEEMDLAAHLCRRARGDLRGSTGGGEGAARELARKGRGVGGWSKSGGRTGGASECGGRARGASGGAG